jgi:hypothetical protein
LLSKPICFPVSRFPLHRRSLFENRLESTRIGGARARRKNRRGNKVPSLGAIYSPVVSRSRPESARLPLNFRIAPTQLPPPPLSLSLSLWHLTRARGIRSVRQRCARDPLLLSKKTKSTAEIDGGTGKEKIKRREERERERERRNREGAEERIEKSSASIGSHISFEVRKPTSGVLTSPSGTTFRKIILLGAKAISIDSPRSLRRGCGEGASRGRRVEARG